MALLLQYYCYIHTSATASKKADKDTKFFG